MRIMVVVMTMRMAAATLRRQQRQRAPLMGPAVCVSAPERRLMSSVRRSPGLVGAIKRQEVPGNRRTAAGGQQHLVLADFVLVLASGLW